MNSCCFLKYHANLTMIQLKADRCLYVSYYTQGGWKPAEKVAENVRGSISAYITDSGYIFVYHQDENGNIVLHRNDGTEWKSAIILKNSSNLLYNLKVHSLSTNGKTQLLYNIPADISGGFIRYKIVSQELLNEKWGSHRTVDAAIDYGTVFNMRKVTSSHYLLFYIKQLDGESAFGYKEFYEPDEWSEFKLLHKTPNVISDFSVIVTKDGIHAAFIVDGPRRQLLYVTRTSQEASPPAVLLESAAIEKVILFMFKMDIHIIFTAGRSGNFSLALYNGAHSFSRPIRVQGPTDILKAEYVNFDKDENMVIGDLFTESSRPGSALFLEDIYSDFYPSHETTSMQTHEYIHDDAYEPENKHPKTVIDINNQNEVLAEKTRQISTLEKKLEESYREISMQNIRIVELNQLIDKMSSDESRETTVKLKAENTEKTNTIAQLQNRIMQLQSEIANAAEVEHRKNEKITETEGIGNNRSTETIINACDKLSVSSKPSNPRELDESNNR